ncbi:MAG: cytochrome C oxidase subunit IV family protein [Woeseiaceae bacterium]
MKHTQKVGILGAWAVLMVATVVSSVVGLDHKLVRPSLWLSDMLLTVAFIKVGVIGWWFMELRGAPPALRLIFGGWVVAATTALILVAHLS